MWCVLQCVAVCCSVLQCVAVWCGMLQYCCSVCERTIWNAMCAHIPVLSRHRVVSVLQYCCSVLQQVDHVLSVIRNVLCAHITHFSYNTLPGNSAAASGFTRCNTLQHTATHYPSAVRPTRSVVSSAQSSCRMSQCCCSVLQRVGNVSSTQSPSRFRRSAIIECTLTLLRLCLCLWLL